MDARTTDFATGPAARQHSGAARPKPLVLLSHLVEPPGQITGIARYGYGLFEAMIRRANYRYIMVTAAQPDQLPDTIVSGLDGIITLPYVRSTPLNLVNQFRHLPRIARQTGADFLYSINPMAALVRGLPTAITVHDLYYDIMPELYAKRHLLWWRSYFKFLASRIHTISCVSENTAADLERFHPHLSGKPRIVPGAGVMPHHPDIATRPAPEGEPYVLLLGNVTPNKNVGFLVDALKLLAAEGRPVRTIHVGRDHSGELARALADTPAGLIETRGGLDDAELEHLLVNAAALMQPSLFEGFGLPIIEAQERGVPVVASDIPVFREVGGHGADLVALGDVSGLASALSRLVRDHEYRSSAAQRALTNASRYSWDNSAAAAEKVIAEGLADSAATPAQAIELKR
ncbi:MAG: glycosyltransferase family 4 protein [Hyphomicrobiales bacterium]|nr:glycosyltransferase family 4 protein [Hyphomicrobiales bacterium]